MPVYTISIETSIEMHGFVRGIFVRNVIVSGTFLLYIRAWHRHRDIHTFRKRYFSRAAEKETNCEASYE